MKKKTLLFLLTLLVFSTALLCVSCKKHTQHTYGEWTTVKQATCTEKGERERVCTECKDKQTEEIEKLEHDIADFEITKQPDCLTNGEKSGVCQLCKQSVRVPIEALGHDSSTEWKFGDNTHWHQCSRCNEKTDESYHSVKDGVCQVCGWQEKITAELTFELLSDGTYAVTGFTNEEATAVVIPATYQGIAITTIGANAFKSKKNITSVTIPEGITTLKSQCFYGSGITSIVLPDTLTICEEGVFQQSKLESVTFGAGLSELPKNMFWFCSKLTSVSLPASVTSIGESAFYSSGLTELTVSGQTVNFGKNSFRSSKLEKIVFAEGVEKITETTSYMDTSKPFYSCAKLTEIELPSTVSSIYSYFFTIPSLKSIKVDEKNAVYSSLDGILYDKAMTTIKKAPEGIEGTVNIPASMTAIPKNAFNQCLKLTAVNLHSAVKTIGENAFSGTKISSMSFPDSVEKITGNIFRSCTELKSVHIGSGLTNIGEMFNGCKSVIDTITVSEENTKYKSVNNAVLSKDGTILYRANKNGDIPEGVVKIAEYAFENNELVTNIIIPEGVERILRGAFSNCTNLVTVKLPSSLRLIESYAFQNTAISEITITEQVVNIECWAFDQCTKLAKVTFANTENWKVTKNGSSSSSAVAVDVTNAETNAENFLGQYYAYRWSTL